MTQSLAVLRLPLFLMVCSIVYSQGIFGADPTPGWRIDFFDDFETFDHQNWQDQ